MAKRIRPARFHVGPTTRRTRKAPVVAKVRRDREQAYTADWQRISEEVIARDGYRCTECHKHRSEVRLEAHHIIPVHRGGKTVKYNLKTVCVQCHKRKPFHGHLR